MSYGAKAMAVVMAVLLACVGLYAWYEHGVAEQNRLKSLRVLRGELSERVSGATLAQVSLHADRASYVAKLVAGGVDADRARIEVDKLMEKRMDGAQRKLEAAERDLTAFDIAYPEIKVR